MTDIEFDALQKQLTTKKVTPSWLKKANKGNGHCKVCKTQYMKGELNAQGHCHHCADELGETHPINR